MFCSYGYNRLYSYMLIPQYILIQFNIIVTVCALYVVCFIVFLFDRPSFVTERYDQLLVYTEYNFHMIWLIPCFWCTHIHTSSLTFIILIYILSHFYYSFYFEVTLFVVETIFVVNEASQVVPNKLIHLFLILHVNTIINAYMVDYYCYCCHTFTVFSLSVIFFIFVDPINHCR